MFAVIVTCECIMDEHCSVGPFETEEQAEIWAVDKLIEIGHAKHLKDDDRWALDSPFDDSFDTRADLLDAYASDLGFCEWFHIVPIVSPKAKEGATNEVA